MVERFISQGFRGRRQLGEQHPLAFICGPTQMVETASAGLLPLGYDPARVKTERFGPTGGS